MFFIWICFDTPVTNDQWNDHWSWSSAQLPMTCVQCNEQWPMTYYDQLQIENLKTICNNPSRKYFDVFKNIWSQTAETFLKSKEAKVIKMQGRKSIVVKYLCSFVWICSIPIRRVPMKTCYDNLNSVNVF